MPTPLTCAEWSARIPGERMDADHILRVARAEAHAALTLARQSPDAIQRLSPETRRQDEAVQALTEQLRSIAVLDLATAEGPDPRVAEVVIWLAEAVLAQPLDPATRLPLDRLATAYGELTLRALLLPAAAILVALADAAPAACELP